MPERPRWLNRLPEITARINALPNTVVDRRTIESVFQLKRRRAIELMHQLGSERQGKGFCLDRNRLLENLRALQDSPAFRWDERCTRDQHRPGEFTKNCPASDAAGDSRVAPAAPALAANIRLWPRRLEVDFNDTEDLLRSLNEICHTIVENRNHFRSLLDE